jgi:hypothetical protein
VAESCVPPERTPNTESGNPARRLPERCKAFLPCRFADKFPGGHRGRVTPVPIPNTEVKPATADGTACAGVWESRSLPGIEYRKARFTTKRAFSCTAIPRSRSQYDFSIGRILMSVTSAVAGSDSAATTIVAISSG